jgi:small subunit ribosomal protein S2
MATVDVDIKKLLESGAHFGHKTSRWHPKMAQYIHSKRNGSHIIDLTKTVDGLETALDFLSNTVAAGKPVLLVGTKRQAQDIILNLAHETNQPFVVNRWLGGMLTNWPTISSQIKRLKDIEAKMASGELVAKYNKLEVQRYQEEIDHKNELYGGIKDMPARPGAVFVVDINHDINAVREARKLHVPVVALVDTNADPDMADYVIPCNDDAIKTLQLIADYIKQAIETGKNKAAKAEPAKDKTE